MILPWGGQKPAAISSLFFFSFLFFFYSSSKWGAQEKWMGAHQRPDKQDQERKDMTCRQVWTACGRGPEISGKTYSIGWSYQMKMRKAWSGRFKTVFPVVTKPTISTFASSHFFKCNFSLCISIWDLIKRFLPPGQTQSWIVRLQAWIRQQWMPALKKKKGERGREAHKQGHNWNNTIEQHYTTFSHRASW